MMEWLKLVTTIIGLAFSVAGAATAVVRRAQDRRSRDEDYRYLDATYAKVLEMYRARPEFGDPSSTRTYATSFKDKDALAYHFFAMSVHTFLETMLDTYREPAAEAEWGHVFRYHAKLHRPWLLANAEAHEPRYVEYVTKLDMVPTEEKAAA